MKKILLSIFCLFAVSSWMTAQVFPSDNTGTQTCADGGVAGATSGAMEDQVATVAGLEGAATAAAECPGGGATVAAATINPQLGLTHEIAEVCVTFDLGTFFADIDMTLVYPDGSTLDLSSDNGGGCNVGTTDGGPGTICFQDGGAAIAGISGGTNCIGPGPYQPEGGDLNPAAGTVLPGCADGAVDPGTDNMNGAWTLQITDDAGGDDHCITGWTIEFAEIPVDFDPASCCECEISCPEEPIVEVLSGGECCAPVFYNVALEGACPPAELTFADLPVTTDIQAGWTYTANPDGFILDLPFFGPTSATPSSVVVELPFSCAAVNPCCDVFIPGEALDMVAFDWFADGDDGTFWINYDIIGPDGSVIADEGNGLGVSASEMIAIDCATADTTGGVSPTVSFSASNNPGGFGGNDLDVTNFLYTVNPIIIPLDAPGGACSPEAAEENASGSCFPEGITTVAWAAVNATDCSPLLDAAGAPVECSFDIEVLAGFTPVTSLTCNDHLNISLDAECQVALGADDFLEGGPYMCYDDFIVNVWPFGIEANALTDVGGIPLSYPKGEHTYEVCDTIGNCCWGTFLIEDKLAPEFCVTNYSVVCHEDIPTDVLKVAASLSEGIILKEEDFDNPDVFVENSVGEYCFDVSSPCETVTDINVSFAATFWGNMTLTVVAPDGTVVTLWDPGPFGLWSCPNFMSGIADLTFDDDAPQLPCSCLDFQGGGTWDSEAFCGAGAGSLGDFEGLDLNGEWCVLWDVTDAFTGPTEVFELSVFFNDGDTACDAEALTVGEYLASADQCDCAEFSYADTYDYDNCENGTVTRTWTCTDACGNVSDPVVQTITITPLDFDGLGEDWFVPPPLIVLPCGTGTSPDDIVEYFDDYVMIQEDSIDTDGDGVFDDFIDVDWDGIYDFLGDGSLDVPGIPTGDDCPDSDIDCPDDIIEFEEGYRMGYPYYWAWGCDAACRSKNTIHPQPIDNNVCNLYVTYVDQTIPACEDGTSYCPGNEKVIRTWTVLDWCTAETIDYVQLIKSIDKTPPVITANDITKSVDPWGCEANFQFPAPEHLHDDCSTVHEYWVSGIGVVTNYDADGNVTGFSAFGVPKGEHQYIYEASDCCGNVGLDTITVTIGDHTPPTPIVKQDIVIGLTSITYDTLGTAKLYAHNVDNGSHDGDCGPVRLEIRRPTGANQCGNNGINGYNNNVTFNNDGNLLGHPDDNPNDTDGGEFVKFCCADLTDTYEDTTTGNMVRFGEHQVILRVWDSGTDMIPGTPDDNYNETWANIRVEDKLWPVIACPPDVTVCCGWDPEDLTKTGVAYANGTCGDYDVAVKEDRKLPGYDDVCNEGAIERTWDIVRERDPETGEVISWWDHECEQIITVLWESCWDPYWPGGPLEGTGPDCIPGTADDAPYEHLGCVNDDMRYCPDDIDWPDDETIICADFEVEPPTWPAETCDLIGWNVKCDTFFFEEGADEGDAACFKVLKHWTLINWCVEDRYGDKSTEEDPIGTYTHTQVLKFYDEEDPIVEAPDTCIAVNADCEQVVCLWGSAEDGESDCMSAWIKWQVFVDLWGDWTIDYEFSSYVPQNDLNFGTPINELYIPPTSPGEHVVNNGSTNGLKLPEIVEGSKYEHRVVWKASDGCGNVTSHTSYFTVEDKKAPTPYCLNVSTALMDPQYNDGAIELWACDFELGSFDNCTPYSWLRWSFGADDVPTTDNPAYNPDSRCTAREFTCDDLNATTDGIVMVDVYVWDECDNYDFCTVELRLVDNQNACDTDGGGASRIEGNVATEFGVDVDEVEILISSDQSEYPMTIMTDAEGIFTSAEDAHYDGYDYIIEAERDIEYLNGVSTIDIVIIQRHILGLANLDSPYKMIAADVNDDQTITAFDLAELRKLILGVYSELPNNESWRFADAAQNLSLSNPFNYDELLSIVNLNQNEDNMDFVGIKIGDVNESVILSANGDADTRSAEKLNFIVRDAAVNAGEEFTVDFTAAEFEEMLGYQFTLNTAGVELVDVVSGALTIDNSNVAVLDANTITVSWNTVDAITVENEVLFSMTFKANEGTSVLDALNVSSAVTSAEAYNADLDVMDVTLGTGEVAYTLHQNEPNPFNNTTVISFELPESADATMTVYDVTGKVVKLITGTYAAGLNTVTLTKDELGATGVLYYTLESGDFTATKKMIIIE